ncbi:hypothetical protein HYPSUDRAFT_302662 [Hypholoma sublateritium FD-334 SS-4]|uniref:C2H2-type domain-containing protein n=1 Tax=Hypholoma sublateritium (strain FD-334 SS-4) TaxID=945553 RepID=A0A0D2P738_HYPSF|nr:hypothetical protein HYPSUDRAFT_302662 [Hypholoma sublateritium FD-334 SS-4]
MISAVADREVLLYAEQQSDPRIHKMSYGAGHPRRFASYFGFAGPAPAAIESRISHDSDGTWEFVTPQAAPVFEGTEAQRFAMMYRNGSLDSESSGSTLAAPPPGYHGPGLLEGKTEKGETEFPWEKPYTPIFGEKSPGITYDRARERGLLEVFQEAVSTSEKFYEHSPRGERIPCPRPGCKDHLSSASNLVYHLHIHNIEDNLVTCLQCRVTYENCVDIHRCPKRRTVFRHNSSVFSRRSISFLVNYRPLSTA